MYKRLGANEHGYRINLHFSSKRMTLVVITLAIVLLNAGILSFVGAWRYYSDRFLPNVKVAGTEVGNLKFDEAKVLLAKNFKDISKRDLVVRLGDQAYHPTYGELGIGINWQNAYNQAVSEQANTNFWSKSKKLMSAIRRDASNNYQPEAIINSDKVLSFAKAVKKESDAAHDYSRSDEIDLSQLIRNKVDAGQLASQIDSNVNLALKNEQFSGIQIDYANKGNVSAQAAVQLVVSGSVSLKTTINFTYDGKTITPTKTQMGRWITFRSGSGIISRKNIQLYAKSLAKRVDIKASPTLVAKNMKVTREGTDGRALKQTNLVNDIINLLEMEYGGYNLNSDSTESYEIPLEFKTIKHGYKYPKMAYELGLYEGKYIDINLTKQRMYLIIGTKMVATYIVSTGKPSTPTPTGTYKIQNKIPRAYSRMAHLWMPWWMGVHDGVGIHELPEWGNGHKEGEWDLGLKVSHGCIRLGIRNAKKVYDWTPIGTPVHIHN